MTRKTSVLTYLRELRRNSSLNVKDACILFDLDRDRKPWREGQRLPFGKDVDRNHHSEKRPVVTQQLGLRGKFETEEDPGGGTALIGAVSLIR